MNWVLPVEFQKKKKAKQKTLRGGRRGLGRQKTRKQRSDLIDIGMFVLGSGRE